MKYRILSAILLITILTAAPVYGKTKEINGIDVSKNNGTIDWPKVAEQGIDFAMIKTGDGKDVGNPEDIDAQFEANYQGAGENGIARGVYHAIAGRTVADAKKEAKYCLSILNGRKLEYPIAYDIESANPDFSTNVFSTGKQNITNMAIAFCKIIKEAGYTPMIYTSASILNDYLDYDQIKGIKVWVAHHDVDTPNYNYPYQIWQYTQNGQIDGANNHKDNCDLNTAIERLTLSKTSLMLKKGKSYTSKSSLSTPAASNKVIYTSSNKKVATVSSSGKITAKAAGKATITAKAPCGTKVTITVTVTK